MCVCGCVHARMKQNPMENISVVPFSIAQLKKEMYLVFIALVSQYAYDLFPVLFTVVNSMSCMYTIRKAQAVLFSEKCANEKKPHWKTCNNSKKIWTKFSHRTQWAGIAKKEKRRMSRNSNYKENSYDHRKNVRVKFRNFTFVRNGFIHRGAIECPVFAF